MRSYSERTRIKLKFDKLYVAMCLMVRLGSLATNYLNVIVSGISTYGIPDELHPAWYVLANAPRIHAL